jgi:hypothetical protein
MTTLSACIISTHAAKPNGYCLVKIRGKTYYHHRLAYAASHGLPIAALLGKVVMHKCDTRNCINPDHLVLGTQQDNITDMIAKGRGARGEAHSVSKLTTIEVLAIRATIDKSYVELASAFGVRARTISDIKNRHTWKHV